MFCNMVKAYAGLSPAMREMLRPLKALHFASGLAARNNARDNNASPITSVPDPAEHPVVRTHPGDRKSAVYGKSVAVRVDLGGRRSIKKKQRTRTYTI